MARFARVVVPDHPHHVTQRGNGRARTFFDDSDYALYRDLLAANCRANGVRTGHPLKPGKRGPKPSRPESRLRALSPNHEFN
jgi:hypothetical protein